MLENLSFHLEQAARSILQSRRLAAFTGAGISVESGIPPFRGENGLWSKYDPSVLDIQRFYTSPQNTWTFLKEVFYPSLNLARPNLAHQCLNLLEKRGILKNIITMNIDNLHFSAGNQNVIEFHGNYQRLLCTNCDKVIPFEESLLNILPPVCPVCKGLLKPDIVFFGENIPTQAYQAAFEETHLADVWLIIGTTGEVYPAAAIPHEAKRLGSTIIEINPNPSEYTHDITDTFLQGKAGCILSQLNEKINHFMVSSQID
jgi:NAD-dependent deacetylase